jgi:hypothetical protein
MKVEKIKGCCSAITISNNPDFNQYNKKVFTNYLVNTIKNYNKETIEQDYIPISDIKTVIIISNEWFPFKFWLRRGFTYFGWRKNLAHVYHVDYPNGISHYLSKYTKTKQK